MVQQYRDDFAMVLPSHIKPETWVRLAVGLVRRDQKLAAAAQADPTSLMAALMDAARQGLEPGTEQYYLTPRKVKGKLTVLGIRGYQGEIELMYRAGAISSVIVEVVRDKDTFQYSPGRMDRPEHEIDWEADDRGKLRLVYAYAIMKDGAVSKVVVLNKKHIAEARAMSQGADSEYSPWQRSEEAMWLKTAAHRLQKWVPTSSEYIREQLRAAKEVAAEPLMQTVPPVKNLGSEWVEAPAERVYEGELVDENDPYLPNDPDLAGSHR
jgi:recombination protein RecT